MKRQLPIGFLLDSLSTLPTYTQISRKHGFRLLAFSQYEINWVHKTVNGFLLANGKWQRKVCPLPRVVYNRVYAETHPAVDLLSRRIGTDRFFNLITHFDKWNTYQILQSSPVKDHLPQTYACQLDELPKLIERHQSVILKPRKGHQGLGIWRIQLLANKQYALYHDFDFPATLNNNQLTLFLINYLINPELYLVQEYIALNTIENRHFDMRVLVQKNSKGMWQASATLSRIAKKNYFITNISNKSLDGFALLRELNLPTTPLMEKIFGLSIATANALEQGLGHLGEISVDFGLDRENKPWIIEVNGKPNKELFKDIGSEELVEKIYLQPILYAHHLALAAK